MNDVLWNSFLNASRAAAEGEALLEELAGIFNEQHLSTHVLDGDAGHEDHWSDDQDNVNSYFLSDWKAIPRVPGATRGFVSVAVSFWRPEDEGPGSWPGARLAKLFVAFSTGASSSYWQTDTLVLHSTGRSGLAQPKGQFTWQASSRKGTAWFFCVELLPLVRRDDLIREVVEPLSRLLADFSDTDAFAGCTATIATPIEAAAP